MDPTITKANPRDYVELFTQLRSRVESEEVAPNVAGQVQFAPPNPLRLKR